MQGRTAIELLRLLRYEKRCLPILHECPIKILKVEYSSCLNKCGDLLNLLTDKRMKCLDTSYFTRGSTTSYHRSLWNKDDIKVHVSKIL